MIALLCSVQVESDFLLKTMSSQSPGISGSKPVIEGTIAGREVVLCIGGMGKVNAAHAATMLLSRPGMELLIVFGIAGAYPASGARVGDLAVARDEIAGDEGVEALGRAGEEQLLAGFEALERCLQQAGVADFGVLFSERAQCSRSMWKASGVS